MSKVIKRNSLQVRATIAKSKTLKLKRSAVPAKETSVVLFGTESDPEVKASMRKISATGRKTELQIRPTFDAGMGPCGKQLCHCKGVCNRQVNPNAFHGATGAFSGDMGSMMGTAY